jgi:hypothetical protein
MPHTKYMYIHLYTISRQQAIETWSLHHWCAWPLTFIRFILSQVIAKFWIHTQIPFQYLNYFLAILNIVHWIHFVYVCYNCIWKPRSPFKMTNVKFPKLLHFKLKLAEILTVAFILKFSHLMVLVYRIYDRGCYFHMKGTAALLALYVCFTTTKCVCSIYSTNSHVE